MERHASKMVIMVCLALGACAASGVVTAPPPPPQAVPLRKPPPPPPQSVQPQTDEVLERVYGVQRDIDSVIERTNEANRRRNR